MKISIGTFHNKVWYDVVPIDACHLLLGRPWKFDSKTLHDGGLNTYSFKDNEARITLFSLKEKSSVSNNEKMFLSHAEFLKAIQNSEKGYLLMIMSGVEQELFVPEEVKPLLEDFKDVFPKDIPTGQPPM